MPTSTLLHRAPRSTWAALALAERQQDEVIVGLRAIGEESIADRLERCQQARRTRQPGQWPWRCGSAGCWACRRTTIRTWWRGFLQWLSGPDVSLVTIPLPVTTDLISTIRKGRKSLRDVRDRAARTDERWSAMAIAGMLSGNHLVIVVQHAGIERDALWAMLEQRWPMVSVRRVETIDPRSEFSVEQIVRIARLKRGIEPIRVIVPAQVRANDQDDGWGEAMPIVV